MNSFKRILVATAAGALAFALAGCATGPRFSAVPIPTMAAYTGRIYIYRASAAGVAIQPDVKLNGAIVGSAVPGGFFYVDRPPGTYTIATSTELDQPLRVSLTAGETRYVRLDVRFGWWFFSVYPTLVGSAEGEKNIRALRYTGPARATTTKAAIGPPS